MCQALLTTEPVPKKLALLLQERLTARQCCQGACLSNGAVFGLMRTGRHDFTEVTIEYMDKWDQNRDHRQDWLGQGAEVHTSLRGVQGGEAGGVGMHKNLTGARPWRILVKTI